MFLIFIFSLLHIANPRFTPTYLTMNDFTNDEFDFAFLEEGFSARDILERKINEVSQSVSTSIVFLPVVHFVFSVNTRTIVMA